MRPRTASAQWCHSLKFSFAAVMPPLRRPHHSWGRSLFRPAKDQVGLSHYEGRNYMGLMRHMILCQTMLLLLLAEQAKRMAPDRSAEVVSIDSVERREKTVAPDHGAHFRRAQRSTRSVPAGLTPAIIAVPAEPHSLASRLLPPITGNVTIPPNGLAYVAII